MSNQIQYSAEQIRDIAKESRRLLNEIEKKAELIAAASEEIRKEYPSEEMDETVLSMRVNMEGMLAGYRAQIRHMELAADFYRHCANEVYAEAEQLVKGRRNPL